MKDIKKLKKATYQKEWNTKHRLHKRELLIEWCSRNIEHVRKMRKKWMKKNINNYRKYQREYQVQKLQNDIEFKLKKYLRNNLYHAIKNNQKAGSAVKDLGCSIDFLKQYLESKFLPGMSWKNWGNGTNKWNIDHIIPLSNFDLTKKKQFLKACHYTNLQPLWYLDNLIKNDRISHE